MHRLTLLAALLCPGRHSGRLLTLQLGQKTDAG